MVGRLVIDAQGGDWRIAPDNRLFRNRAFGPGLGVSKSASEIGAGVCAGARRLDPPLIFDQGAGLHPRPPAPRQ